MIVAFYSLSVASPIHMTRKIIAYLRIRLIKIMIKEMDYPVIFDHKISLKYSLQS